ncbi:MAG: HEAT repeat domain-containing protein [Thermodesulfobacteriota bacterium]
MIRHRQNGGLAKGLRFLLLLIAVYACVPGWTSAAYSMSQPDKVPAVVTPAELGGASQTDAREEPGPAQVIDTAEKNRRTPPAELTKPRAADKSPSSWDTFTLFSGVLVGALAVVAAITAVVVAYVVWHFQKWEGEARTALAAATSRTSELQKALGEMEERSKEAGMKLAALESRVVTVSDQWGKKLDLHTGVQRDLERSLKGSWETILALAAIIEVEYDDKEIRRRALQKLTQLVHPVALGTMVRILEDNVTDEEMRRLAAYGLGRYSENVLLMEYWRPARKSLERVLGDDSAERPLPHALRKEVLESLRKLGWLPPED